MAKIHVQRDHQLSLGDIRAKASDLAEQLAGRFGGKYQWQGDNLHYKRSGVNACIACTEQDIIVDISLKGLMVSALRGTIESEVKNTLSKHLS
ncbi:MAG: polyhydroxyalkanoic acid system family protein [Porticoccaceae bacterium]|nr:polyhydroxyalkanoic acid system family protein [Porticoccaceae bacterium]